MQHSARLDLLKRKSQRATISLPQGVLEDLRQLSDEDGRSLSNLIAFMVETQLQEYKKGRTVDKAGASRP
jgi:metal-responsive CopG/Arc/MetJ family transcriptional regulator